MAAGGGRVDTKRPETILGSDAVYTYVCQPCSYDENVREAVGFCMACAEWLCEECFRFHKRPKPSRHHVLKTLEEMKNSEPSTKPADKCTKECVQHSGKHLKYYCSDHEIFGCSFCVIQEQRTCKVDHISIICESTDIKNEFQKVTANLEVIAKESKNTASKVTKNQQLIQKSRTEAEDACQIYKQKLKVSPDEKKAAFDEKCEKSAKEETEKMKNVFDILAN